MGERGDSDGQARLDLGEAGSFGNSSNQLNGRGRKTNLTIENEIKPQINLLAEGQSTLLAKLAPRSEVEELKEKVEFLEAIVRANTREIEALKKAQ